MQSRYTGNDINLHIHIACYAVLSQQSAPIPIIIYISKSMVSSLLIKTQNAEMLYRNIVQWYYVDGIAGSAPVGGGTGGKAHIGGGSGGPKLASLLPFNL